MKRYIRQALTVNDQGIPRFAIEIMKRDPVYFILVQMEFQKQKLETQTEEERIEEIRERIIESEGKYGGKFEVMFGDLTDEEIDFLDDGMDMVVWKVCLKNWQVRRSRVQPKPKLAS